MGLTICEPPYRVTGVVDASVTTSIKWILDGVEQTAHANSTSWEIETLDNGEHTITMIVNGSKTISSTFNVDCPEETGNITPAEQNVCIGAAESMTTDIDFTGVNYQWQSSTDNVTWVDITGADKKTYAIVIQKRGTTFYRVVATNGSKTVTSNSARVRIRSCILPVNHNISVMKY